MGYDTAAKTDAESVVPEEWGGMWFLKSELDTDQLGFTILELDPGGKGKEHAHEEDGQEEVYYVIEGRVDIEVGDDETVALEPDEAIRLDADQPRQIHNRGEVRAKLVLVGAPL